MKQVLEIHRQLTLEKGKGKKKVWSLLGVEKEALLLFVLTVLPAI